MLRFWLKTCHMIGQRQASGTPSGQLFSRSSHPSTPALLDAQEKNLGGVSSGTCNSTVASREFALFNQNLILLFVGVVLSESRHVGPVQMFTYHKTLHS